MNYASSKAGADEVVAAITAAGGEAIAVGGDVSKAADAKGIIDSSAVRNLRPTGYSRQQLGRAVIRSDRGHRRSALPISTSMA